jgi:calcium-binding protein CML
VDIFDTQQQPPKQKSGKKRSRKGSSSSPPEDLIEDNRRQEILRAFQEALVQSCDDDDVASSNQQSSATISLSDTKRILRRLELEGIKGDEIITYFDDDMMESLDADMFLRFAAAMTIQKEKAHKAFSLIDEAGKGVVVLEDLQRVARDLGEEWTDEELTEMIEFADRKSGEGFITKKHFFKLARRVNL